jgi:Flp pilus assembly protein TadB
MPHPMLTATLLAAASNSKHLHIGPWIVVPILILIAIIATPVYVIWDRRKRRSHPQTR